MTTKEDPVSHRLPIVGVVGEFITGMVTPLTADYSYGDRGHYWYVKHSQHNKNVTTITFWLNDDVLVVRGRRHKPHRCFNLADPDCFEQVEKFYRECVRLGLFISYK